MNTLQTTFDPHWSFKFASSEIREYADSTYTRYYSSEAVEGHRCQIAEAIEESVMHIFKSVFEKDSQSTETRCSIIVNDPCHNDDKRRICQLLFERALNIEAVVMPEQKLRLSWNKPNHFAEINKHFNDYSAKLRKLWEG